jgi:hypothetical protein
VHEELRSVVEVEWATKQLDLSLYHVDVCDELHVVCVWIHMLLVKLFGKLIVL